MLTDDFVLPEYLLNALKMVPPMPPLPVQLSPPPIGKGRTHSDNGSNGCGNGGDFLNDLGAESGPCTVSMMMPERAARLAIGKSGHNVDEFERLHRCLVDVRTSEKRFDGEVPVDITARDVWHLKEPAIPFQMKTAFDAKDALLRFLDRHIQYRDWPTVLTVRCSSPVPRVIDARLAHSDGSAEMAGGVSRLTFMVSVEDAPRLIGTRGANKRRLEERANCALTLRTEERRGGQFPVDVIARSAMDCERAKQRILTFLDERPRDHVSSPSPISLSPSKRFLLPVSSEGSMTSPVMPTLSPSFYNSALYSTPVKNVQSTPVRHSTPITGNSTPIGKRAFGYDLDDDLGWYQLFADAGAMTPDRLIWS